MLYPSINEIKKKADSRYSLVILAAKRARDIVDGKPVLVDTDIKRPVSIATKEINEDLIKCRYYDEEAEAAEAAEEAGDAAPEEPAEEAGETAPEEAPAEQADAGDDGEPEGIKEDELDPAE